MIEEQEAFAPYSTDDGKAVSIVTDQEHLDSYLLFTNKTMDRFANILAEALDFNKEDGFYLNWKDGEFVYGWKWNDERLGTDEVSAPEGLTFGEIVEKIMSRKHRIQMRDPGKRFAHPGKTILPDFR